MSRRKLDMLLSTGGAVFTVVLLVASALLFVGYNFTNSQVHDQLSAQRVFFPPKGDPGLEDPQIGKYLNQYAGQQLTTGAQAEAYANHYIAVHLKGVADGKTYAEVSTLSRANPDDAALAGQVQTLFRGETLRGLLLTAYAFWKVGQIALMASVIALALGALMLVVTIMGFWHMRRVSAEEAADAVAPPAVIRAA